MYSHFSLWLAAILEQVFNQDLLIRRKSCSHLSVKSCLVFTSDWLNVWESEYVVTFVTMRLAGIVIFFFVTILHCSLSRPGKDMSRVQGLLTTTKVLILQVTTQLVVMWILILWIRSAMIATIYTETLMCTVHVRW